MAGLVKDWLLISGCTSNNALYREQNVMATAKNAMEIFSELDRSNCGMCGEKTCLAFAGAVFTGVKNITECPRLESNIIRKFSTETQKEHPADEMQEEYLCALIEKATQLDFDEAAKRIGGENRNGVLTIKVLGKLFGLGRDGRFMTDLHVNPWVIIPLLEYICNCKGRAVTGEWISYREIPQGREKYNLFKRRGEDVLKRLADRYTDFFRDIIQMFNGEKVAEQFESDVSVVLYPLPLAPLMICYWRAEEGMESKLNLFFDKSIGDNLGADLMFYVGTGLAQMFEKLAEHHGF